MRGADQTNAVMEVIACATWAEFVERCADDFTRGGMFLPTTAPHEVWTVIGIALRLPAGHEVVLRGRVVHVIDAVAAAQRGMSPGIGVEFVDLDGPRLGALNQMLHYARTEGSAEVPRYSFAQWLAQNASFQAPQQIMASLPPAPAVPSSQPPEQRRRRRTDRPEIARPMKSETAQSSVRRRSDAPVTSPGMPAPPTRSMTPQPMPSATGSAPPQARRSMSPPPTSYARDENSTRFRRDEHSTRYSMRPSGRPGTSDRPAKGPTTLSGMRSPARTPTPPSDGPHATRDPEALKLGMAHLARRRYRDAQVVFREMLDTDPGDIDAQRWIHVACARRAVAKDQPEKAIGFYRKVLEVDPANREAKDKIATLERNAKLSNLPFGRFFAKK